MPSRGERGLVAWTSKTRRREPSRSSGAWTEHDDSRPPTAGASGGFSSSYPPGAPAQKVGIACRARILAEYASAIPKVTAG